MKRLWIPALITSICICFPVLVSTAATPPKPGSVCKKANLTNIYLGKKYTCIKIGKKLVWSKGAPVAQPKPSTTPSPTTSVSPIPTPTPTATPSPTPTTTPQSTPTPTPSSTPTPTFTYENSGYSNPEQCKLKDVLVRKEDDTMSSGFPNISTLKGKSVVRTLGLYIDFPDAVTDELNPTIGVEIAKGISDFYSSVSYGKTQFKWDFTSKYYRMPHQVGYYHFQPDQWLKFANDEFNYLQDAVNISDTDVDFSKYDLVILFPSRTTQDVMPSYAYPGTHSGYFWKIMSQEGLIKNMQSVMGADYKLPSTQIRSVDSPTSWVNITHEIGHEYGLPDQYLAGYIPGLVDATDPNFNPRGLRPPQNSPLGIYDHMGNPGTAGQESIGWSRWLLGWFDDEQIICLTDQNSATLKISPIETVSNDQKLIILYETATTGIAIELRQPLGQDWRLTPEQSGVLIYRINTSLPTQKGNARALKSNPKLSENFYPIYAHQAGESYRTSTYEIRVLTSGIDGAIISIARI